MFERCLEVPFDPLGLARRLSCLPGIAFLYSGLTAYGLGRYSILAARPKRLMNFRGESGDCFSELRSGFPELGSEVSGRLPFYGGCLGYFSYEAGISLECKALAQVASEAPLARFAFYEGGIVFDHESRETWLVTFLERPSEELEELASLALDGAEPLVEPFVLQSELRSNFEREEYLDCVKSIRSRIRSGDVYQVNLSQRFAGAYSGSGFDFFARLAEKSPSPYSAYLNFGDEEIVSSSPERFLLVEEGVATTRPIKGTRAVGCSEEESLLREKELRESEKDRSELLMIVDLERNDLGRVCEPGSVRVDELFRLERYSTVIHQTADVSGALESGMDALDCARAMFPGGSITGAPKIRSMQIIDELERGLRGVYTGSIGYLDASGRADFNIAIRTLRLADGHLSFQVGGGIVWDSDPDSEYEETLLKARAMIEALKGGANG